MAVLLLAALLVGVGATQKQQIFVNDGISYLAAAGNQVRYRVERPVERWVPAREWQRFWREGEFPAFDRVARDLARHDIHPPLYFWLLHVWGWCFGTGLVWAPLLNLLFLAAALPVLYSTCRAAGASATASLAASGAWTLGGGTLSMLFEVRHYPLLALVSIGFTRAYVAFARSPTPANVAALCLLGAAGLLTHFHFALLIAAAGLHAVLRLRRGGSPKGLVLQAGAALGSVLLLVALHPAMLETLQRLLRKRRAWERELLPEKVPARLLGFGEALLELVLPLALAVLVWLVLRRGADRPARGPAPRLDPTAWQLGALAIAAVGLLFVTGQSPKHAMAPAYLVVGAPALFVALAAVLDRLGARLPASRARWLERSVLIGFLASGVAATTDFAIQQSRIAESHRVAGGRLVLDTVSRGHLPPILWHADPATLVYAAPREALLASLPPGLDAPGTLFYLESRIRRDVSDEQRRVMLDAFRASGHEVRATGERVYRPNKSGRRRIAARVFLLEPTGSGGGAPEGVSPTP